LAGMTELLPRMKQRQSTFDLIEDVEYTRHGGEPLCLDILRPKGAGPHPVLIYLHGGAFAIGSKRSHRALAAAYAAQGYLVCNVDYRLAPKHPFLRHWKTLALHGYGWRTTWRNTQETSCALRLRESQQVPTWPWPSRWRAASRGLNPMQRHCLPAACVPAPLCCIAGSCRPANPNATSAQAFLPLRHGLPRTQPVRIWAMPHNIPGQNMHWPIRCAWSRPWRKHLLCRHFLLPRV
jgi:hypothetical protein